MVSSAGSSSSQPLPGAGIRGRHFITGAPTGLTELTGLTGLRVVVVFGVVGADVGDVGAVVGMGDDAVVCCYC